MTVSGRGRDEHRTPHSPQENMLNWNVLKRWSVPWSMATTLLTVAIAIISCDVPFIVVNKVAQHFKFSCGADGAAILNLGISSVAVAIIFGVLFVAISFHQPIPNDVFHWAFRNYCFIGLAKKKRSKGTIIEHSLELIPQGLKKPFNLQKGWLLWAAVVGLGYYYALVCSHPDLERIPSGLLRFFNSSKFSKIFGASWFAWTLINLPCDLPVS